MSSSKRSAIVSALIDILNNNLDGNNPTVYLTNMYGNVKSEFKYFDEINDFPYISVVPGPEKRGYTPHEKWGDLTIYIRIFVKEDNPQLALEQILADVELALDLNEDFSYTFKTPTGDSTLKAVMVTVEGIETDQGVFSPEGLAEMILTVKYNIPREY